jgi:hypothetical protein
MPKKGHSRCNDRFNSKHISPSQTSLLGVLNMVVRIKEAVIETIEDTDTRRLKLLRIVSKATGEILVIELPEALCSDFSVRGTVNIVFDSKPIATGAKSKLYAEGIVYKIIDDKDFEVIGTIGGLRFVLTMPKTTPAKKKTFETGDVFLALQ